MNFDLSPQFQSYLGLHQVLTTRLRMQTCMKEIITWCRNSQPTSDLKLKSIRLLDTFLSDSLDDDVLRDMFNLCLRYGFQMNILILDPFSQFAAERARALDTNPLLEVDRALLNLRNSLRMAQRRRCVKSKANTEKISTATSLLENLQQLEQETSEISTEIRFYEALAETPVYLLSQFAAKGLLVHGRTAANNPWLILVDDPSQIDDLYDHLSDNFNAIWESSKPSPDTRLRRTSTGLKTNVLICHGNRQTPTLKVKNFLREELKLNPILFEDHAKPGLTIIENLEIIAAECSSSIIIITKEDVQENGQVRARQNVIHELGYCHAYFGRERVVVMLEEGAEIPSNISGILYTPFRDSAIEICYEFLRKNLSCP